MASLEAKFHELLAETRNLREDIKTEQQERKLDHDTLTRLDEQAKTLFKIKEAREKEIDGLTRRVGELERAPGNAALGSITEGKSRKWAIGLEIVGALAAAIVGGLATKYLF
jgi:hypothetical protein